MKLAVIFNGQGAHYNGMGLDFDQEFNKSRQIFNQSEEVTGLPLRDWIADDDNQLKKSQDAQITISTVSLAIYEAIKNSLPTPTYMAGLSLGEYTSLIVGGYIDYEQGFKMLAERGRLMSQFCEELNKESSVKMAAVNKVPLETVQEYVKEFKDLYIANMNSESQTVVAGSDESIKELNTLLKENSYRKSIPLKVEGPFHSPYMQGLAPTYKDYLTHIQISDGDIPVVSNTDLSIHDSNNVKRLLTEHLYKPVQWKQTIDKFEEIGITHIIQIGPGETLAKLLQRDGVDIPCLVVDKVSDVDNIESFLG